MKINLQRPRTEAKLMRSDRIVASNDGNHFFTCRPDWRGPVPLPFRAAAAVIDLVREPAPKVLILGYGMGAMGALMLARHSTCTIVAVEPNRGLYDAARDALDKSDSGGLSVDRVQLHLNDALGFLRICKEQFDLILDDCFVEILDEDGEAAPYRPRELEVVPHLAKALVRNGGLYARNLLDQDDLGLEVQRARILQSFTHSVERTYRDWDNVLTVASNHPVDKAAVSELGT